MFASAVMKIKVFSILLIAAAFTAGATVVAVPAGQAEDVCPNATLRTGASAALPDCRAYELVSSDSNHSNLNREPGGASAPDGGTMVYQTIDAPEHAVSAAASFNFVRAKRDPVAGWSGVSLSPPVPAPITAYRGFQSEIISPDFSSTFVFSDQPLTPGPVSLGQNSFVGRLDGTYRLLTTAGTPLNPAIKVYAFGKFFGGTSDFRKVFFAPTLPQLPSDPTAGRNTYEWSEGEGLRLVGILPDGTPAPNGVSLAGYGLPGFSADARYVAFLADDKLFVRRDGEVTAEVSASQRTVDPDPNAPAHPSTLGVTADGSKVLFTSASELTNDANTGRSSGVATDAGQDLYSYDTATGHLTDLTADSNPADVATGANVQLQQDGSNDGPTMAATPDGSYIYFMATGMLAPGATPGHRSLYVWHDGGIDFVANADNLVRAGHRDGAVMLPFYVTPDGQSVVFASTDSLTGYDNTDPVTGQPHSEIFKATRGSHIECASCRPDGSRPTGDSSLPYPVVARADRVMSDDGRRVFFHSTDAVLPQASSGLQQVFEYSDGRVAPISPMNGSAAAIPGRSATFLDASASGNDVFFETFGDVVPGPNSGDDAVIDARVDGGFPLRLDEKCAGAACRSPSAQPPRIQPVASIAFLGVGSAKKPAATREAKVAVSKVKAVTGTATTLKIKVPGRGSLKTSGFGVRARSFHPAKAQTVAVRLALTSKAAKSLRKSRSFKTRVRVVFSASGGHRSSATLSLSFKYAPPRKGL